MPVVVRKEITALTGLRGIAALWVFLFHVSDLMWTTGAREVAGLVGAGGYLGVDIFFVLSGFILAYNYGDARIHQSFRAWMRFLGKRLARIYPVHIAALLLLAAVAVFRFAIGQPMSADRFTVEGLMRTLSLTEAWSIPPMKTWNIVSWSISCEWAAYLVFPLLASRALRLRSQALILATIGSLFVGLWLAVEVSPYAGSMAHGPARIAAEFTAGLLLYRLWALRQDAGIVWDYTSFLALLVLVAGANGLDYTFGETFSLSTLPILAVVVVYSLACANDQIAQMFSKPIFLMAGQLSYSFYMVHLVVIYLANGIIDRFDVRLHTPLMLCALVGIFVTSAAIAHFFFHRIEEPMRRRLVGMRWLSPQNRLSSAIQETRAAVRSG